MLRCHAAAMTWLLAEVCTLKILALSLDDATWSKGRGLLLTNSGVEYSNASCSRMHTNAAAGTSPANLLIHTVLCPGNAGVMCGVHIPLHTVHRCMQLQRYHSS
ncbi:hypothetical protein BZA05DRAFT_384359 [Tricharina praecox]|uniref:uncharacterized protein n=1 Tax=Tricharina praecox TaxID=43433 RepID=UPI00221F0618|nr:uncharacterized protein BZA05DRAFT_384359 [Tricharina praecox]KAI5857682.1 hypothetical protein BZA05DRAFT_384359 [Tricharina praecox]